MFPDYSKNINIININEQIPVKCGITVILVVTWLSLTLYADKYQKSHHPYLCKLEAILVPVNTSWSYVRWQTTEAYVIQ